MIFYFSFFLACQTGPMWSTQEDCEQLKQGDIKDDCWSNFLLDVFKEDPARGRRILSEQISNPKVRDFLWLEVTRKIDPTTMTYCKEIKDTILFERCQVLVSRPHLHRETLRGSKDQKQLVPAKKPQ